jgi:transposase-like protein
MAIEMTCPTCGSHDISKNGTSHRGKQNYKCRDCGRQFVENPQWQPKPKETQALVNRLLHEKIPLAGIARATETSEGWVQGQANATYASVSQVAEVAPKLKSPLKVQMDELWSFVDHKGNKQWVWLAMDAETREVDWLLYRRPFSDFGEGTLAVHSSGLSPMRQSLYGLLGRLRYGDSEQTP